MVIGVGGSDERIWRERERECHRQMERREGGRERESRW